VIKALCFKPPVPLKIHCICIWGIFSREWPLTHMSRVWTETKIGIFQVWFISWSTMPDQSTNIQVWGSFLGHDNFFNSSQWPTLYVIYFTVPRCLFYLQKIGWLLTYWWKGGLESTKYSISPSFFRGESLATFPLPLPHSQPFTTPPPPLHPYLPPAMLWQWHRSVFTGPHRWAAAYFL